MIDRMDPKTGLKTRPSELCQCNFRISFDPVESSFSALADYIDAHKNYPGYGLSVP